MTSPTPRSDALRPDPGAAAAAWAERVRAGREQSDRLREADETSDFYGPMARRFAQDPRRTDDPALEVLRQLAHRGESWLDIGAGGGRYALPLALTVARVVAVEPSPSMLEVLRAGMGTLIGALSALTGTGGGALTGPTLKAFSVPLKKAIATASATGLVVGTVATIAMILQGWSVPGRPDPSLGYLDIPIFLAMLPTTLIGAPLGVKVNHGLSHRVLNAIYTVILFIIAADVIWNLVK